MYDDFELSETKVGLQRIGSAAARYFATPLWFGLGKKSGVAEYLTAALQKKGCCGPRCFPRLRMMN